MAGGGGGLLSDIGAGIQMATTCRHSGACPRGGSGLAIALRDGVEVDGAQPVVDADADPDAVPAVVHAVARALHVALQLQQLREVRLVDAVRRHGGAGQEAPAARTGKNTQKSESPGK